ncbi:MAG: hypothetical protein R2991_04625 [Thermoanaerobaculia bacterium]
MSVLREGFREITRKLRRLALRRRIRAAGRARSRAHRELGRRALETGAVAAAGEELRQRLGATQARDRELAAGLATLEENRLAIERKRDAETARLTGLEKEATTRKDPLDAELAGRERTLAECRKRRRAIDRRLADLPGERRKLEEASQGDPAAAAGLAALSAEADRLAAELAALTRTEAASEPEAARLRAAIAPLRAELDRLRAERRQVTETAQQELAAVRKEAGRLRAEAAGVAREHGDNLEELGRAVAGAAPVAALAAEAEAVRSATKAEAELQSRHDASMAQSRSMPRGTMGRFAGLMAAAVLALGAAAWAATQAAQAIRPSAPNQEANDCSMPSDEKRPPVEADAGGPYTVVRGEVASLDGSRSKGRCLTYVWTFGPAPEKTPPPPQKPPRPATGLFAEDQGSVAAIAGLIDQNSCPSGVTGNPGARKEGAVAPTPFLCSLQVTLTVKDDSGQQDSDSVIVRVRQRDAEDWRTTVEKRQNVTYEAGSHLVRTPAGGLPVNLLLGTNVCAIDDSPDHALHAGRSWLGTGFDVTSVSDPGGPFDGWWYVAESDLKIQRAARLNADLQPSSAVYRRNLADGYRDIETLAASVTAHEREHGNIVFEKMARIVSQKRDPASSLEGLATRPAATEDDPEPRSQLITIADAVIGQIETFLYPPQGSPEYIAAHLEIKRRLQKAYGRAGKIELPDGSGEYGPYPITPSFAQTGENGGG